MKEEPERRIPDRPAKSVLAEVVKLGETPTVVSTLGRVVSSEPVQVVSEVSGILERGDIPFKPGRRFRRGDILVRIDDRQARLTLNSTKSDFLNALAGVLPEIKVDHPESYNRWQEYFDRCGFDTPLSELPEAENRKIKLLLTRLNVYRLYYAARNLEITLDKHTIRAPFDGAIVSTAQREGATARSGGILGEIISLQDLELEAPVPAADLPWIDRNADVRLRSRESNETWTGRIARIAGAVERKTQTLPVYITVRGNGTPLYEGLYLEAEIPGRPVPSAAVVPRRALYENRFVYIVENQRLLQREVTIIRSNPETVIVSGGLSDGDTLVTELLQGVAPGMPVTPRFAETVEDEG
ncbi:MAG: efflux RND transporter periplasmic adaptor subunit [Bacteroidetes bacterium]|nr:efflux RND transporter periplasmic adaptor subunit [Bacteroidota bacterium]